MNDVSVFLTLTPRDPLIARDGRPFSDGLRMRSLDWLYPSVLTGSLRTMLGNLGGGFPDASDPQYETLTSKLKSLAVAGPFPAIDGQLHFPSPQDIAVRKGADNLLDTFAARPVELSARFPGAGCDLPNGLEPALLPDTIADDFKPDNLPAFWSCEQMVRWLTSGDGSGFLAKGTSSWPDGFVQAPNKDTRTHVQMDFSTGAGKEGMLFQSTGLVVERFRRASEQVSTTTGALAVRVADAGDQRQLLETLDRWHPLGGERRLVRWRCDTAQHGWQCPVEIRHELTKLQSVKHGFVRLVLASPALFADGWKPGWLQPDAGSPPSTKYLAGQIPGTSVRVRLISACIDRWKPISGWGYEPHEFTTENGQRKPKYGPKAVRRLVPAGGVYFFKVDSGDPAELADRWLASVCDDPQDGRDGFGLALWGVWQPLDMTQTFDS